jgi:hypothetical protein
VAPRHSAPSSCPFPRSLVEHPDARPTLYERTPARHLCRGAGGLRPRGGVALLGPFREGSSRQRPSGASPSRTAAGRGGGVDRSAGRRSHLPGFEEHLEGFEEHLEGFEEHLEGFEEHLEGFEEHLEGFEKHLEGFREHSPSILPREGGTFRLRDGSGSFQDGVRTVDAGAFPVETGKTSTRVSSSRRARPPARGSVRP